MVEILEDLPNTNGWSIAIDERGIIIEGNVDPLYKCSGLAEMVKIWNKTEKQIMEYFESKCR